MKKRIRKILIALLALVFLGSLAILLYQQQIYRAGEGIYTQAEQLVQMSPNTDQPSTQSEEDNVSQPPAATTPEIEQEAEGTTDPEISLLESFSIAALQQVSSSVVGWIQIPDTELSYPLVQGNDNDFYLNHAWDGTPTAVGSIFMDYRCAGDLNDFHTIIYGHRMRDGSMFNSLRHYKTLSYWESHPYVYIKVGNQVHKYAVFAAYEAPVHSPVYDLTLPDQVAKQTLIEFALDQTLITTGVVPTVNDQILTLSTCTGNGYDTRWVVQAAELQPNLQK